MGCLELLGAYAAQVAVAPVIPFGSMETLMLVSVPKSTAQGVLVGVDWPG